MRSLRERIQTAGAVFSSPRVMRLFAGGPVQTKSKISLRSARRVLVLKLDEIGDFVMTTPFLRELRANAPQAEIVLVVKPVVYNLAANCPHVNQVLVYDWDVGTRPFGPLIRQARALRFVRRELRPRDFDLAFIPRWDADAYHATQLALYARALAIVAYSEKTTPLKQIVNRGYDDLVSHALSPVGKTQHETTANLAMLERCGGEVNSSELELWLTSEDLAWARAQLPEGKRYVAIAAGAARATRCWPTERFAEIMRWLQDNHQLTAVLLGLSGDPRIPGVIDFLGRTTLRQSAAILGLCRVFVGNDSGLKHIAAAVKTPVVEISCLRLGSDRGHYNSPDRFHAWGVAQRVVRPPPGPNECAIEEVSLDSVKSAMEALLQEIAAPPTNRRSPTS
jgi:ADP-heptose:LPS heptosyltransferase